MSFFIEQADDGYGGVIYNFTSAGNVALIIGVIALFSLSMLLLKKKIHKISEQQLVFTAMAIALGTVLSNLKLFHFPTGGSITLFSMLIICLPGYWYGLGVGSLCGLTYGILQLILDPYIVHPVQFVIDYLLAFTVLGLSGCFKDKKNGLTFGYILAVIGRFVCAVLSGWIFFGSYAWEGWGALSYSLAYNAIYIFSEMALTLIVIQIPAVKKALARIKQLAVSTETKSLTEEKA